MRLVPTSIVRSIADAANNPAVGRVASILQRCKQGGIKPSRHSSRLCRYDFDSLLVGINVTA